MVTANLANFHRSPLLMLNQKDVANGSAAKLTVAVEATKIVTPEMLPARSRHDLAVLFGVTPLAQSLALIMPILSRETTSDVGLVMDLKHYPVRRSA
jgi:hypothetical protein